MKMSTNTIGNPKIVSREEWLEARKKLLAKEKQLTRERDALAAERRQLPWVKVEKNYVFDGPNGKLTLADLFDGKSQLIIYHFMFGSDWQEGCPSCSFNMDHTDGALVHLAQRDVSFAAISRAPYPKIAAFKNAWAGASTGCLRTATISTETIMWRSPRRNSPRARWTITSIWGHSPVRKRPESACFTRTRTEKSSTPTPLTHAAPRRR